MGLTTIIVCQILVLMVVWGLVPTYGRYYYRFDYEYNEEAEGWLKYHNVPMTWAEARMQCHAEGAVLASPLTNSLKETIIGFVKNKTRINDEKGATIFTGVHATYSKGVYSSVEGVPLLRLSVTWAPGEPDNFDNSESCLIMIISSNGTMADAQCDGVWPYVCYKKKADMTVNECGTTDHEYVLETKTGSCYKYHSKILSWPDAYRTCEAEGAYLTIINSNEEAEVIKTSVLTRSSPRNFKSKHPTEVFIGYHDWGNTHNYMTIHGQSLNEAGYQKWMDGQPNNLSIAETDDHGQPCGGIHNDGRLNNLFCNLPFAFICEMTPNSLR